MKANLDIQRGREAIKEFNERGIDAFLDLMDPDIEVVDLPQVVEGRVKKGREAVVEWFRSMEEIWEDLRIEVEKMIEVDEHRFIVAMRFCGRGKESGAEVEQRAATVFTERDGKLIRSEIYSAEEEALQATSVARPLS